MNIHLITYLTSKLFWIYTVFRYNTILYPQNEDTQKLFAYFCAYLLSCWGSMQWGTMYGDLIFELIALLIITVAYQADWQHHVWNILCAYWGFVCMSLHLGFHWSMMLAMARKHLQPSSMRIWSLRLIGWLWAVYGAFAFRRRGVSLYLLLRSHFVFYDYSEPVILFLIDYLSVMVMFVLIGYLISMLLKRLPTFYLH